MKKLAKAKSASFRYAVRLNEEENMKFQNLMELSGSKSKSDFIRARLFAQSFKVVTMDKATVDFYNRMTQLNAGVRKVGVLYNQVTRALNTYHSAKVAHTLVEKLEAYTQELNYLLEQSCHLAEEVNQRWLQK